MTSVFSVAAAGATAKATANATIILRMLLLLARVDDAVENRVNGRLAETSEYKNLVGGSLYGLHKLPVKRRSNPVTNNEDVRVITLEDVRLDGLRALNGDN